MKEIKVKRIHDKAILPTRGHASDAGLDLYFDGHVTTKDRKGVVPIYHTGICVDIPDGYVGIIKPRSGLSTMTGYSVLAGVIDAGYRGEIMVVTDRFIGVMTGDKFAQLLIVPIAVPEVVEVSEFDDSTDRDVSGFGSTGS